MIFLDSNILVYASGIHGVDEVRTGQARAIVRADRPYAISVQVLQEFYDRVTRPRREAQHLSRDEALAFVTQWRTFKVESLTLDLFDRAVRIEARLGYRYWDCAIIAAAQALGCHTIYTEDMQHGQIIDGTGIVNPFRGDIVQEVAS